VPKGTYEVLEIEYDLCITNEIMPMLAELNDKFEADKLGIVVGLLPSRKGTRIVVMRLDIKS
jgi:hypothetical protein